MFARALTLSALAFIPTVLAQGNLTGLLQALNSSGLDQFANVTVSVNGTPIGNQILGQLSEGNKTLFAPSDGAWSSVNPDIINNETRLADIVSYHIVLGNFINKTQTYPNETIGRTLFDDPRLVMLEGDQSQVLVWSKSANGSLFVLNNGTNITVTNTTTFNASAILAIDSVLVPPPNISVVLNNPSYNTSLAAGLLQIPSHPNGTSILDLLSSARGITLFAPSNAGVQAAQSSLAGLSRNATALRNVLFNHVINGTTVYSTEISNSSTLVSAAGQDYAFSANSTGVFVSVGGSNQVRIMEPNVLTSNGVIYVVDGVMLDTNSNAGVASSAFASATSAAQSIRSTATKSVTVTSTSTSISTSAPTPTSGGMAKGGANNWKMAALVGMIVGFVQLA